jgi:calcium-dependent protein kinase
VSELCTGGELFDKIIDKGYLDEFQASNHLKEILSAIVYCHNYKIVHRDLKPENILYLSEDEDSPLKVIDFGTAKQYDVSEKLRETCGTPYYIAPEVLEGKYNEKCDV